MTLTVPPRHIVPPDPSFLLLRTSWLYFYNCSILLVTLGDFSLSSCLQYLLCPDRHLCPTLPLAEVSVQKPSALPAAEMSSLILARSFQPWPVSQLEFFGLRASELFWTAIHLFCLHHPTWSFLGFAFKVKSCYFPYRPKSELYTELNLLPRVTFTLITVLTSCLMPWETPLSHVCLFKGYYRDCFCFLFYLLHLSLCLFPVRPQKHSLSPSSVYQFLPQC